MCQKIFLNLASFLKKAYLEQYWDILEESQLRLSVLNSRLCFVAFRLFKNLSHYVFPRHIFLAPGLGSFLILALLLFSKCQLPFQYFSLIFSLFLLVFFISVSLSHSLPYLLNLFPFFFVNFLLYYFVVFFSSFF